MAETVERLVHPINMSDITRKVNITVRIKGLPRFHLRMWIMRKMFEIACGIGEVNGQITTEIIMEESPIDG